MKTCPKCNSTLPDWAQQCQFCGSAVAAVASPDRYAPQKKSNYAYGIAPWVWVAYYTIAGWFVLSGLYALTISAVRLVRFNDETAGTPFQTLNWIFYLGMAWALIGIGAGIGLLLQNDFVKALANYFCVATAIFAFFSFFRWMGVTPSSFTRTLNISWSAVDMVSGLLMLYLIFETNDNSGF